MGSGLADHWVPKIARPQHPGESGRWVSWIQSARVYLSAQVSRGRLQGTRCAKWRRSDVSLALGNSQLGRLESGGLIPGAPRLEGTWGLPKRSRCYCATAS